MLTALTMGRGEKEGTGVDGPFIITDIIFINHIYQYNISVYIISVSCPPTFTIYCSFDALCLIL